MVGEPCRDRTAQWPPMKNLYLVERSGGFLRILNKETGAHEWVSMANADTFGYAKAFAYAQAMGGAVEAVAES